MESLTALLHGTGAANMHNGPTGIYSTHGGSGSSSSGPMEDAARKEKSAPVETTYPDWKMELTMERLKQKVAQTRTFTDLAKNVRTAIMERRSMLDHHDKQHLQKSLDILQQNIKVNSLQSMVERLEMISRQQGLRFHPGGTGNEWFISSDMFFLELLIDSDGVVQEVKIQHDGKTGQQNCPEIITTLQNNDFTDFAAHLSGLVSIYALNADKNIKSKVFIALQALETDLSTIASTYTSDLNEGDAVVMKSLLGIVKPRTGGHPLRLTFYITPYEFLDTNTRKTFPNDVATILKQGLGTSATVAVQASQSHRLQMTGVVSVVKTEGKSVPRYGALNSTNSTALPACFTFNLKQPIAICTQILEKIHSITGIQSIDPSTIVNSCKPILRLLTDHLGIGGGVKNGHKRGRPRGLFVELPDQLHCYYMTEMLNLDAVLVSSIPFTLASQLPAIITLLRQQLAFNTLIASCIRSDVPPSASTQKNSPMVFEINPLSYQNITVTFEHPLEESLVTLEIDLSRDVCHPPCKLHAQPPTMFSMTKGLEVIPTLEEHACRVAARTMSIPVTLRAVIRRWQAIRAAYEPPPPPAHEVQLGGGAKNMNEGQKSGAAPPTSCRTESATETASSVQRETVPTPTMVASASTASTTTPKHPPRVSSAPAAPLTNTSTLTISPVPMMGSTSAPGGIDLLAYMNNPNMNPLLKSLSLSQFQNPGTSPGLHLLAASPAYQLLATQLAGGGGKTSNSSQAAMLELFEQIRNSTGVGGSAGTPGKKRKRKSSSSPSGSDSTSSGPVPILPAPSPAQRGHVGPKRRLSESSSSESAIGGSIGAPERTLTPNTLAREIMMSEYGLDSPRHAHSWAGNTVDITPVTTGASAADFMTATKLLSAFGAAAAANIKQEPGEHGSSLPDFLQPKKQSSPSGGGAKRPRDHTPKRSMSLDSGHLQSQAQALGALQDAAGRMVPASLSITPVPLGSTMSMTTTTTTSTTTSAAAQAILAGMKPGIEIIPLPGHGSLPISIPNSITVTPIVNKSSSTPSSSGSNSSGGGTEKKPSFTKKMSADEFDLMLGNKKRVVEQKQRKGSLTEELLKKATGGRGALNLERKPSLGLGLSQKTGTPGLLNLQKKAGANSPLGKANLKTSGSKAALGGKPSVSTLKSAAATVTSGSTTKPKPKDKKGFSLTPSSGTTSSPKSLTKSSSFPAPPTLRPIYDNSSSSSGSGSNSSTTGGLQSARSEPSTPTTPTTPSAGGILGSSSKTKGTGFTQTGTVTKKLGLAGVIDKLKSQASVESIGGTGGDSSPGGTGKKELSRLDYLKASSNITTEMQKVKGGNGSGTGGASAGETNPEYMVKPGGTGSGGLKLTIKTPAPSQQGKSEKTAAAGSKTPGNSNSSGTALGQKRPFSPSGSAGSSTTKTPMASKKPKLTAADNGRSSPSAGGGGGASASGSSAKPKEQQLDLTKKLFQPGAVRSLEPGGAEAPKFDTSFQIPKKKPTTPATTPTGPTAEGNVKEGGGAGSKEVKTPSPPAATTTKVSSPPTNTNTNTTTTTATTESSTPASESMQVDAPAAQESSQTTTTSSASAPASPDSIPMQEETVVTPTIPTTPVGASTSSSEPEIPVLEHSTPPADRESEDTPASPHETTPPILEMQQQAPPSAEPVIIPTTRAAEETSSSTTTTTTTNNIETGATATPSSTDTVEMPPPPLPTGTTTGPSTPTSAANVTSPSPATVSNMPNSPASAPVASPSASVAAVTSIVHIVHSPQPPSPMTANVHLRSPLVVVNSPHSVGGGGPSSASASPFMIDDDLMDEALTGGNCSNTGKTAGSAAGTTTTTATGNENEMSPATPTAAGGSNNSS